MYQKGKPTETITLSHLRWYPACGTDKWFCSLNSIPINQTFGFSTDMTFLVTGSVHLNKLLCWNKHPLSPNRRQPTLQQVKLLMPHKLYLGDKQMNIEQLW